ncbi:hypothetical protein NOF04DRAFT_1236982 [Fusarium oxysporum II5]|nr:hypothetical protein NOF04DRAFT_1236982 [Fusarium oxysporum II5]
MPHTQENYRVGSPCTYQQPPFFLLPPIELQQPQPNAQAYYPQLISSLYGNNLSEFATPSCIDPRWLHDLSSTVGTYRSAACHLFHPADQTQTLGFSSDIPDISAFTFFDANEIMPSDLMRSGINKFHISVISKSPSLISRVPVTTPSSHGENSFNTKHLTSNATLREYKRGSSTEEPQSTRALKRRRFSLPHSELKDVKLPYLGNFRCGDMNNRRKVALVDNSSSSSHQTNITDQVDTFAQDPLRPEIPAGDATYAILELSKRYRVVSKESIDILYATKARVPAETVLN